MADKQFVCGYSYCLHPGEKVKASEAVVVGKKHFHWDCAAMKQDVKDCIDMYMDNMEDKSLFPIATKILNTLVFQNQIPVDFIKRNISASGAYYRDKPVYVLYGLRKLFWEKEFKITK